SSSRFTRDQSSNPTSSTNTTLKARNHRSSKQRVENSNLEEHLHPVVTMADNRTMTKLLRAPTEGYKDLLRACPHHVFTELHQLDTFYNALNPVDQDSLNAAAGGNLLERNTQDVLTIIENKSKVRNSRSKPIASQVKACDINSNSEIAKLTHVVNQQTSAYYQCLAAGGNTFPELRDNIQGYVSAAAVNYNQSNPGSGSLPSNTVANPKGELKAITTRSGLVTDGPTIPTPSQSINPKVDERVEETFTDPDLAEYTIKVPPPSVQKYKPPGYPKKLPEKLGDPGKFLIPCGFSELKCKALADLGVNINLISLYVWKKLGLPELIPTCMTLELANRAICTPAGIARDVFVSVGKFTFPADFVIVDYESDPRVPIILGRPFLQTARALIDVHGEEMILRDDFLKDLFSNQPSGNPTFLPHPELTSPKVTNDIFDSEGCIVLSEKLQDLASTKDPHPHLYDNPLGGNTTYFSNSLLEEFADELPQEYDDNLQFDIESDLKEIELLLYQDKDSSLKGLIDQKNRANLDDIFVDSAPEMFTDKHALDYPSPPIFDVYDDDFLEVESDAGNVYDDPFDSKGEKIEEVDAWPSTNNEDKVFKPGILIQEKSVKIITRVVQDKKLAISNASLVLEEFDPYFYEPLFFKEVPKSMMLLPFSSEMRKKFSNQGYTLLKSSFLFYLRTITSRLSCFQNQPDFQKPDEEFSFLLWKGHPHLGCSTFSLVSPLISSSMGELGQAQRPKTSTSWEAPRAYP
nr:reverse transcriptase domain-containing protein [Tanacetum cinerariifolium]